MKPPGVMVTLVWFAAASCSGTHRFQLEASLSTTDEWRAHVTGRLKELFPHHADLSHITVRVDNQEAVGAGIEHQLFGNKTLFITFGMISLLQSRQELDVLLRHEFGHVAQNHEGGIWKHPSGRRIVNWEVATREEREADAFMLGTSPNRQQAACVYVALLRKMDAKRGLSCSQRYAPAKSACSTQRARLDAVCSGTNK